MVVPLRPSIVAALGLIGGFAAAKYTNHRQIGGAVFAAAGVWCEREWARTSGPLAASARGALYTAAMGGSHPLPNKIGAWPSVIAVAVATVAASELVTWWTERHSGL